MRLTLERIGVTIDGRRILDDVSLDVAGGERLALLGPSGSGKSTALRVIAGLQAPSAGRVLLEGRDVTRVPAHRRRTGLVFQDAALFPHRDVAGNVGFGPRVAGLPEDERRARVSEALDRCSSGNGRAKTISLVRLPLTCSPNDASRAKIVQNLFGTLCNGPDVQRAGKRTYDR